MASPISTSIPKTPFYHRHGRENPDNYLRPVKKVLERRAKETEVSELEMRESEKDELRSRPGTIIHGLDSPEGVLCAREKIDSNEERDWVLPLSVESQLHSFFSAVR